MIMVTPSYAGWTLQERKLWSVLNAARSYYVYEGMTIGHNYVTLPDESTDWLASADFFRPEIYKKQVH